MRHVTGMSLLLSASLWLFTACQSELENEIQDVREARERSGQVVQQLESEIEATRERLQELERRLALAREGITEEVIKERKELQSALEDKSEKVNRKAAQAEEESSELGAVSDEAVRQLDATEQAREPTEEQQEQEHMGN